MFNGVNLKINSIFHARVYYRVTWTRDGKLKYEQVPKDDTRDKLMRFLIDKDFNDIMYCEASKVEEASCELIGRSYICSVKRMAELQKEFLKKQQEYQNAVKYIAETRACIGRDTLGLVMYKLKYDFDKNVFMEDFGVVKLTDDTTLRVWVDDHGCVNGQCARNEQDECKKRMLKKQMELINVEHSETTAKILKLIENAQSFDSKK